MSGKKAERETNDSAYVQLNILSDESVAALAEELRAKRPSLRCMSSLLAKMPFHSSSMYKVESISEWLLDSMEPAHDRVDFLLDLAKYLDWWERNGVYQETGNDKRRKKNKEISLLIRRFGLERATQKPAPDQFMLIQSETSLNWTETHQWLVLLRFFDIMANLRGVRDPDFERVPPSPARLLKLTGSLTQTWLSMRVDWQAAIKACGASLAAANVLGQRSQAASGFNLQIGSGPQPAADSRSIQDTSSGQVSQVSAVAQLSAPAWVLSTVAPDASTSSAAQVSAGAAAKGDVETMQLLFAKFDDMSLTAAFERIIPSMKKADEQGQYLAMCVNIQLAALAVKFIQSHARVGESFHLKNIVDHVPAHLKTDWMAPRYIYQPFMLMITYSPLFVLARTRLYSSPLPSMSVAFEIFKAMGNMGKPEPLQVLERSIWAMVLQVAQGLSVYDVLPVYMAGWLGDIDSGEVTACKSWLDDFGLKKAAEKSGPVEDWDEEVELRLVRDFASLRDELREWKPELNVHGKRRLPSPEAPSGNKRQARGRQPKQSGPESLSLTNASGTSGRTKKPAARSSSVVSSIASSRPVVKAKGKRKAQVASQSVSLSRSRSRSRSHTRSRSTSRSRSSSPSVAGSGANEEVSGSIQEEMFSGRLTPMTDDGNENSDGPSGQRDGGADAMDVDGEEGQPAKDASPSFVPPGSTARPRDASQKDSLAAKDGRTKKRSAQRRGDQQKTPAPVLPPYTPVPVTVPVWSVAGIQTETWSPLRSRAHDMFSSLSERIVSSYPPGSDQSSIRVFSHAEFSALDTRHALDVFSKHHILVRGGDVDPFWSWGLAPLSALKPIYGTKVHIQDPIASYGQNGFRTILASLPELVKVGKENSGKIWNCLDIPLGERRVVELPHVSGPHTFNIFPHMLNVAAQDIAGIGAENEQDIRGKMHWALAGVAGADTMQHIDTGGFATVVRVLSGRKLWAVGTRDDGSAFANHSHALGKAAADADWLSLDVQGLRWESVLLEAGDTFYMRPGPHMVHTLRSSICYGEYFITPRSLVDHVTSYVLSRMADLVATNDRIDNAALYLSLPFWWWHGDIAAGDEDHDPSARLSRPCLAEDPRAYVAVIGFHVFQTMLAISDFEKVGEGKVRLDHVGERLYRKPAERLHEWVCRQGIVSRKGDSVDVEMSDDDRKQLFRDIILEFGVGIYAMAAEHARTEPGFDLGFVQRRLGNDARAAYNIPMTKWLEGADLDPRLLIPDLTFTPAPRPALRFSFHA